MPTYPSREAARHGTDIRRIGGLHLAVLGLGRNGHIAFNEPGSPVDSRTRVVGLTEDTRRANLRSIGSRREVPTHAITVGMEDLLEADEIRLLTADEAKVAALLAVLEGPVTTAVPASALREHSLVTLLVASRTGGTVRPR